ncbi:ras GEF [Heliocybe sulcata]|uniref:Ras GEF n=1 Tax=Heliocybe sulcata TaxID=5364 RepID=A0A5C3N609_9AGAM|nr:ras GEF [Heliocybe sulcata]
MPLSFHLERARSTRSSATLDGGTTKVAPLTINKKAPSDTSSSSPPRVRTSVEGAGGPPVPPKDGHDRSQSRASLPASVSSRRSSRSSAQHSLRLLRSCLGAEELLSRPSTPAQNPAHEPQPSNSQRPAGDAEHGVLHIKPSIEQPQKAPTKLSSTLTRSFSARVASSAKKATADGGAQPRPHAPEAGRPAAYPPRPVDVRRAKSLNAGRVLCGPTTFERLAQVDSGCTAKADKPLPPRPERPPHRHAYSDTWVVPMQPPESSQLRPQAISEALRQNRVTVVSVYSQASASSESILMSTRAESPSDNRPGSRLSDITLSPSTPTTKVPSEAGSEGTLKWRIKGRRWSKWGSDHYTDSYCTSDGPTSPNTATFERRFSIESAELDEVFPSIFKPYEMIQNLSKDSLDSLEVLPGLAKSFENCLNSAIAILEDVPLQIRATTAYQDAMSGLQLSQSMFMTQIDFFKLPENRQSVITWGLNDPVVDAEGYLDETMCSLRTLLAVVRGIHQEDCVAEDGSVVIGLQDHKSEKHPFNLDLGSSTTLNANADFPEDVSGDFNLCDSPKSETNSTAGTLRPVNTSRKPDTRPVSVTFSDLSSVISSEPEDIVPPEFGWRSFAAPLLRWKSNRVEKASGEAPGAIRLSLYQFPNLFTLDGELEDSGDVTFGDRGEITTATFPALVRVLTSTREVVDYNFTETFFLAFRRVATPKEFYDELIKRYTARRPADLSDEEAIQWRRKARATKLRVVKAIQSWTDLYWRQEVDEPVRMHLVKFLFGRVARDFGEAGREIAQRLYDAASSGPAHRGRRLRVRVQEHAAHMDTDVGSAGQLPVELGGEPAAAMPQPMGILGGLFVKDVSQGSSVGAASGNSQAMELLQFSKIPKRSNVYRFNNTKDLRALAEQLTVWESELYRAVDPYDYYLRAIGRPIPWDVEAAVHRIGRSSDILMEWVSATIDEAQQPGAMAEVYELFARVGYICMQLRNYQTALSIHAGLSRIFYNKSKYGHVLELITTAGQNYFADLDRFFFAPELSKNHRNALKEADKPAVPYMGWFGNKFSVAKDYPAWSDKKARNGEPMINVLGLNAVASHIREMEKYHVEYKLERNEDIQKYIFTMLDLYRPMTKTPRSSARTYSL